jgi:hypothetical protein
VAACLALVCSDLTSARTIEGLESQVCCLLIVDLQHKLCIDGP